MTKEEINTMTIEERLIVIVDHALKTRNSEMMRSAAKLLELRASLQEHYDTLMSTELIPPTI